MEKINLKTAKAEFEKWFESKKLPNSFREKYEDQEEIIIDAMVEGNLKLKDDGKGGFEFIQDLKFGNDKLSKLTFAHRITTGVKSAAMRGVKEGDNYGMLDAVISALTGEQRALISNLDTVDSMTSRAIAIYFL